MRDLQIVAGLPGALRVGEPVSGPLALVPVFGGRPAPAYRLAAQAIAAGTLSIGEVGGGQVPQLLVRNGGELPVLLVEGEHLQGAMQDRVLNVTVLVPADADTEIPVSCVEHGRWGYRSAARRFAPAPDFSYTRLRAEKTASVAARRRSAGDRRSDQSRVWAEVERKRAEVGVASPTAAMRDSYGHRAADLDELVRSVSGPAPGQTGVVVCVGGRAVAFDGFDRPETFAGLWPRLVRGYALEALGAARARAGRDPAAEAEALVGRLAAARATAHDGVGLGTEVMLTDDGFVGTALVWKGAVVHVAAFADPAAPVSDEEGCRSPGRSWFHGANGA